MQINDNTGEMQRWKNSPAHLKLEQESKNRSKMAKQQHLPWDNNNNLNFIQNKNPITPFSPSAIQENRKTKKGSSFLISFKL